MCEFHKKIGQILKCVVVITADFSGEICKKKIRRKQEENLIVANVYIILYRYRKIRKRIIRLFFK